MIDMKNISAALVAAVLVGGVSTAQASLVFNLPPRSLYLGSSYSQDGYTFTNSYSDPSAYGNWIGFGRPDYNAGPVPNIFQNWSGTLNTITNDANVPFNFTSIGLSDVYNYGNGGSVLFTFKHVGGGVDTKTVDLISGVFGLQNFQFSESNLSSVAFQALTTQGKWIQFNNIGVSSVPLPSALPLFGSVLLGLGAFAQRRQKTATA